MMGRRLVLIFAAVAVLAAGVWLYWSKGPAAGTAITSNGPVILISIDTLRADHLPAYGYTKVRDAGHRRARRRRRRLRARLLAFAADAALARYRSCPASCRSSTACATTSGSRVKPGAALPAARAAATAAIATGGAVSRVRAARGDRHQPGLRPLTTTSCRRPRGERPIGQVQRAGDDDAGRRRAGWTASDRDEAVLPLPPPLRAAHAVRAAGAVRAGTRRTTARSRTPTRSSAGCSTT